MLMETSEIKLVILAYFNVTYVENNVFVWKR